MRKSIIAALIAVVAMPATADPGRRDRSGHDRYRNPYSNESVRRERAARRIYDDIRRHERQRCSGLCGSRWDREHIQRRDRDDGDGQ